MKLTIAFDDASLSLPKMRTPDTRQRVIEAVLDLAAAAGVDDVHLIAALGLHRRMHEYELRHVLGDRIYDAFAPARHAVPARRRGLRQPRRARHDRRRARSSRSTSGPPTATCSCTSTSTRRRWTADGSRSRPGWPSYRCLSFHHNPETLQNTRSLMDRHHSELHKSVWRMGKVVRDDGPKIFQIETTLNTDTFPSPFDFLSKREWEWTARDRATYLATAKSLRPRAGTAGAQDLPRHRGAVPHDERAGRRYRDRAQDHARQRLRASNWSRSRARPTSSRWGSRSSARTTPSRS